jgi:HEAT repeat protein
MSKKKTGSEWVRQLCADDDEVAHRARLRLGRLGGSDAWMAPDLVEATNAEENYTRFWATIGLCRLVDFAPEIVGPALFHLISDPYPAVRAAALTAIHRVGADDAAIATLTSVAEDDPEDHVRAEAVRQLGRITGPAASMALVSIVKLLGVPELQRVGVIAAKVLLSETNPGEVIKVKLRARLADLAEGSDREVSSQATVALERLVPTTQQ